MGDLWVEVRTGEKRYYWNASNLDVLWDPPPGVRVIWAAEKHPETGKTYYWNKETSESVWTLPIPKNEGSPQNQPQQPSTPGTMGSLRQRQERWADVRDGPAPAARLEDFAPAAEPGQPSAGERILGSLNHRGPAVAPGPCPCGPCGPCGLCGPDPCSRPISACGALGGFNGFQAPLPRGCGAFGGCGGCDGFGHRPETYATGRSERPGDLGRGYDAPPFAAPGSALGGVVREERQWWKGGDYNDGEWWAQCRQRFLYEVEAVRGIRTAPGNIWEMLPEEVDSRRMALLELEAAASAASVFPADFCIAGVDPDGPRSTGTVSPGFMVAAFADSPYDVSDALWSLSQTWWALVKATTRLVTLVFVTGLGGRGEDADEEISFLELQRRCLMQSPAPIIFAAQRMTNGGKRARLLGGWQISRAHRDQANEWLNPGSWWPRTGGQWGSKVAPRDQGRRPRPENYDYEGWEDEAWESWDGDTEDQLMESVAAFLGDGPKEVQELASLFAGRFNAVVRADPRSGYSMDKKNDGSFKRWLLGAGFEASALFDRNKCMISVPHSKRTTRGTRGGRKNRGADRGTNSDAEAFALEDGFFEPPYGLNSPDAFDLEEEVLSHLREHGDCDMGALRQVNDLGRRFNEVFFHKSKVNDGSWKKWLAAIHGVEVVVDPKVGAYHGNKPTVVRLK